MANIGYIRYNMCEEDLPKQLEDITLDRIFKEKISVTVTSRPILLECMNSLQKGDTLHVHRIDRIARNLGDLQTIVTFLNERGVTLHSHRENMIFTDAAHPQQEMLFKILESFAKFEKSMGRERQQEGIAKAKKEGRALGRPRKLSFDDLKEIYKQLEEGKTPATLAVEYNVCVSSIYKIQKRKNVV